MSTTKIEWAAVRQADGSLSPGQPWNPTTGCDKISQGCKFCYAEVMTRRLQAMGQPKYADGFRVVKTHPDELTRPLKRKKLTTYFVNSMSALFHKDVPTDFIEAAFSIMQQCPQHTFQILTKRSERQWSLSPVSLLASQRVDGRFGGGSKPARADRSSAQHIGAGQIPFSGALTGGLA